MAARRNKKPPFQVRRSGIQGRGAFATRRIRKGARIIEYVGERISREEETRRYDDYSMKRHHTFLFEVDDETTIDAGRKGNEARYINHSCSPNCEAVNENGRIFIEAIRNIQPGVELTYDYAYEHNGSLTPELTELYICRCGSPKCRGTILKVRRKRKKRSSGSRSGRRKSTGRRW